MNKIEKILQYFRENPSVFVEWIEAQDSYNGFLGEDRYYSMYEFDDLFCNKKPSDLALDLYYGWDEDSTYEMNGKLVKGSFNPNRDYFYCDGYGNPVSTSDRDYSDYLEERTIEEFIEYRNRLGMDEDEELEALFNEEDEE